jgi:outer membrane receptor protein involved in Fe transport
MFVSKFHKFDGQDALQGHNGETDGYNTLSANVSLNIPKAFHLDIREEVVLSVYGTNLLDEEISVPDIGTRQVYSMPGRPGRALYVSVTVKF